MSFKEANKAGQLAQLNTLARNALAHYGMVDARLTLLNYTNNAVYEVNGDVHAVLRVHRPENRTQAGINAELAWLSAIREATDLIVPQPLAPLYEGALGDEGLQSSVVLFGWIDGQSIKPFELTLAQARQIGRFAAHLHTFSERFTPDNGFDRPQLDWEGLFGARSPYQSDTENELFSADQRQIMQEVAQRTQDVMQMIGKEAHNYGMIHADLIAKNILFNGEQIAAIDFDDCGFGYYLYDLAPFLWGAHYEPVYREQRAALWEGYTEIRPQPPAYGDYVEAFVAARHVASCRWLAGNIHNPNIKGRAEQIIADRVEEMKHFLTTGELIMGRGMQF
ncbi:MAG: phosphotransferase [Aggregatilineales bacterium]